MSSRKYVRLIGRTAAAMVGPRPIGPGCPGGMLGISLVYRGMVIGGVYRTARGHVAENRRRPGGGVERGPAVGAIRGNR